MSASSLSHLTCPRSKRALRPARTGVNLSDFYSFLLSISLIEFMYFICCGVRLADLSATIDWRTVDFLIDDWAVLIETDLGLYFGVCMELFDRIYLGFDGILFYL